MRCGEVQAREPLWRRGELGDSGSLALIQHLAHCRACRRAARFDRAFDAALRAGLGEARAPVELRSRVRRVLGSGAAPPSRRGRAPVALALAVALLFLQHPGAASDGTRLRVIEGRLVCQACASSRTIAASVPGCTRDGDDHRTAVQTGDGTVWGLVPGSQVLRLGLSPVRRGARVRLSVRGATGGRGDLVVESARLL